MQMSNRIVKTQRTKPVEVVSEDFQGKTDMELKRLRQRKLHKPERVPRTDWMKPEHRTNVGAARKYLGEEL
ncbi:hypothetical protein Kompost2_00013 [Pseudomonas phage vB_PpuP-Kompost-2]